MNDLISKALSNFQEKITENQIPTLNPNSLESKVSNKKVLLNKSIKSKSQHTVQKLIATSSNQSPPNTGTTFQYSFGQSNPTKDSYSIQHSCQMSKTIDQKEFSNDMININQLIQEKKKELKAENKYFLKEISRIRQDFEMNAKIRNKFQKDRESTTSSQDRYERCWDETLKEINKDSRDYELLVDSLNKIKKENGIRFQRPKPLRSQIFSKIREQENEYFKKHSDSIIKQMKQRSIQLVDDVSAQIQQVQLLKKEQQYQRSKERDEGKQEIAKSLRFKKQEKLLKLLQNKSSNNNFQFFRNVNEKSGDISNSLSKSIKRRSTSFNYALPIIDQKQDKGLIQTIVQQQNQNNQITIGEPNYKKTNFFKKSINCQAYSDLSKLIRCP